jgi:hypothetical protein
LLTENRALLEGLATALLERETLDAGEIDTIIKGEELGKQESEEETKPENGVKIAPKATA